MNRSSSIYSSYIAATFCLVRNFLTVVSRVDRAPSPLEGRFTSIVASVVLDASVNMRNNSPKASNSRLPEFASISLTIAKNTTRAVMRMVYFKRTEEEQLGKTMKHIGGTRDRPKNKTATKLRKQLRIREEVAESAPWNDPFLPLPKKNTLGNDTGGETETCLTNMSGESR